MFKGFHSFISLLSQGLQCSFSLFSRVLLLGCYKVLFLFCSKGSMVIFLPCFRNSTFVSPFFEGLHIHFSPVSGAPLLFLPYFRGSTDISPLFQQFHFHFSPISMVHSSISPLFQELHSPLFQASHYFSSVSGPLLIFLRCLRSSTFISPLI